MNNKSQQSFRPACVLSLCLFAQSVLAQSFESLSSSPDTINAAALIASNVESDHFGVFILDQEAPVDFIDGGNSQLWQFEGHIGVNFLTIDLEGDRSRSPFQFDDEHSFGEVDLQFSRQRQGGGHIHGEIAGLYNDSEYRSQDDGFTLERFYWESVQPSETVSSRVRAGDFFAALSPRALQRPIKGVTAELQPDKSFLGAQHSIQLLSGVVAPVYRDLDTDQGWFNAVSSLWKFGQDSLVFNIVDHRADASTNNNSDQTLFSIGGEKYFDLGLTKLTLEAEYGHLSVDSSTDNDAQSLSLNEKSNDGIYFAIRGKSGRAIQYSLLYEDYGEDFNPAGRAIVANRETLEARFNWSWLPGLRSSIRTQEFIDRPNSLNPLTTRVAGINLRGGYRIFNLPLTVSFDAFSQERFDLIAEVDEVNDNVNARLSLTSTDNWTHQLGFIYRENQDFLRSSELEATELSYRIGRSLVWEDWNGFIEAGLVYRDIENVNLTSVQDSQELGATLSARIQKGHLRHQLSYRSQDQDRLQDGLEDFFQQELSYRFEYRQRQHELSLNFSYLLNEPDPGLDLEAQRLSIEYRYQFDFEANRPPNNSANRRSLAGQGSDVALFALAPGLELKKLPSELAKLGISSGIPIADYKVFEYTTFDSLLGRQRLVLKTGATRLLETSVIIDFDSIQRPDSVDRQFNSSREALLKLLGSPSRSINKGAFTQLSNHDLQTANFVRQDEWFVDGGVIRFGIPSRIDGALRMEIHFTSTQMSSTENAWSLEQIN